jgi:hypothetical protein
MNHTKFQNRLASFETRFGSLPGWPANNALRTSVSLTAGILARQKDVDAVPLVVYAVVYAKNGHGWGRGGDGLR